MLSLLMVKFCCLCTHRNEFFRKWPIVVWQRLCHNFFPFDFHSLEHSRCTEWEMNCAIARASNNQILLPILSQKLYSSIKWESSIKVNCKYEKDCNSFWLNYLQSKLENISLSHGFQTCESLYTVFILCAGAIFLRTCIIIDIHCWLCVIKWTLAIDRSYSIAIGTHSWGPTIGI